MIIGLSGRKTGKIFGAVLFAGVFVIMIAAASYVLAGLDNVFRDKAVHAAEMRAASVLNVAMSKAAEKMDGSDFVNIVTDGDGKVSWIGTDSDLMNRYRNIMQSEILKSVGSEESIVYIPVGSLTNYPVLQGAGYKIPVRVVFDGVAKVDFEGEFTDAGINRVLHRIYITAEAEISVISSAVTLNKTVSASVPVCETVIAGEVPKYYGAGLPLYESDVERE